MANSKTSLPDGHSSAAPLFSSARIASSYKTTAIDECAQPYSRYIATERPLTIYLDQQEIVTVMTLGIAPELLTIGYLLNQRLMQPRQALHSVQVDWDVAAAAVRTQHPARKTTPIASSQRRSVVTTGCGQGTVFSHIMDEVQALPAATASFRYHQSALYQLVAALAHLDSVYKSTGAIHGCALCDTQKILFFIEDVGRHNAVDSIAGYMWDKKLSGHDKIFYTTGRLSSEMVIKAALMGIPVLVSRSGVTHHGVTLAKRCRIMLIARVRGRRFLIYNGAERFVFDSVPPPRPLRNKR